MSWQAYGKNNILITDGFTVKIKLMQKCVVNMEKTKEFLAENKVILAKKRLENTYQILHELIILNEHPIEEIRDGINVMYEACIKSVEKIIETEEPSKCDGVISVIKDILDSFEEVRKREEGQS